MAKLFCVSVRFKTDVSDYCQYHVMLDGLGEVYVRINPTSYPGEYDEQALGQVIVKVFSKYGAQLADVKVSEAVDHDQETHRRTTFPSQVGCSGVGFTGQSLQGGNEVPRSY